MSKSCSACSIQGKKLSEEDFQVWFEGHECPGGFDGSSPSMEPACAKELWDRSVGTGVEYHYMVSDGDSKAYNEISKTYGVCEDCDRYGNMSKTSQEYKNWVNSPEYKEFKSTHMSEDSGCHKVLKLDCVGHVQKRMGKALRDLQKQKGKLQDGKSVGGKSGRLTKSAIEKLQKYYGNAIRNNVIKGPITPEQRKVAVSEMKKEIKAGLYHSCKLLAKERHQFCPENSWCAFKNRCRKFTEKNHNLDKRFATFLEPVYNRLSDDTLLELAFQDIPKIPTSA